MKKLLACMIGITLVLQADEFHEGLSAYQNVITNIDYIFGKTRCTIVLHCSSLFPIINYAPLSYQDFIDATSIRLYLPQTTIECAFDESFGSIIQDGSGVEIVIFGNYIDKLVSHNSIAIIFECST